MNPIATGQAFGRKELELIPDKALIMSGYGINSEMETREALFTCWYGCRYHPHQ
jgi:hypothetical protein